MPYQTGSFTLGNNNLRAQAIFSERQHYSKTFPDFGNSIDLHKNSLYGRIDFNFNPVFPSEAFLTVLPKSNNVFCLNFVADAFNDLRKYVLEIYEKKKITQANTMILQMVQPKFGWTSATAAYHNRVERLYKVLTESYLKRKEGRVLSFDEFTRSLEDFFIGFKGKFMFTRSGFIMSKAFTHEMTGLVINMKNAGFSNDIEKYRYFKDPNWHFFSKAAKSFGFFVDKNAPWRLVADINSPAMQERMAVFGLTVDNLHQRVYYRAHRSDLMQFKAYLRQFYKSFTSFRPFDVQRVVKSDGTFTENVRKRKIESTFDRPDEYWLRLFILCKAGEAGIELSPSIVHREVQKTIIIQQQFGEIQAMDHLSSFVKTLSG